MLEKKLSLLNLGQWMTCIYGRVFFPRVSFFFVSKALESSVKSLQLLQHLIHSQKTEIVPVN